jgi:chromosome segregation ATPase
MKTFLPVVPLMGLLLSGGLSAAEPADPALKLREQLRAVTLQLRTAQTDAANAQAIAAQAEQKSANLTATIEQLQKTNATQQQQAEAAKAAAAKTITSLEAQLAQRDQQLLQTQQTLQQWQEGYHKAAAAATAAQQQARDLQATLATTKNTLADRERKNVRLFATANEILDRYQAHALGKSILAKEPFIGKTRVKIENQVQGYKDAILDNRLAAPAVSKP